MWLGGMGETVHCESFLPSMRDFSEDSNSCSWSRFCGDKNMPYGQYQNGFFLVRAGDASYSENERNFLKQTILEHEAVFKNQVYELHRLYRTQKSLMDEVRGKSHSEHTPESVIKRELPGFLLGNSVCGEDSRSQACNVRVKTGISSKDKEVFEVRPVKVRRTIIDLQLPADEYLDTGGENTSPPHEQSKAGKEVGEKPFFGRGSASHRNSSSVSSLLMKNPNGLTDLNEPVKCQESVHVSSSRDLYPLHGRNIAQVQSQWLENNSIQNGWMVLEAGHGKSSPIDKLCLPSHSVQVLSNNAFQPPLGYPSTDHSKLPGKRASFEWEARQRNPEVSHDSYVESSVASNAPSLNHGFRPESSRPWSHCISSWENRSSSSVQTSLPFQTNMNPFLYFTTQARADSSSEMRSCDFDRLYQGFSSGSKETACNFRSGNFNHLNTSPKPAVTYGSLSEVSKHRILETLQGPKKQECSARLPWIKPKPPNKNKITNGGLDLNASANQLMDGSDVGDCSNYVAPCTGLRSVSCSNDTNVRQVEMADSRSSRKILGFPISQNHSVFKEPPSLIPSSVNITDQPKERNTLVKRNFDINLPCEAAVSEVVVVDKDEANKAATYIDLNLCASEDGYSNLCSNRRVETKANTLIDLEAPPTLESEEEGEKFPEKGEVGDSVDELIKAAAEAIVTISLSHHCRNIDEAASSSTDAVSKDPLSWFVNTIASCGNELEKKDACLEARDGEGCREECSSGEFDYFEAMNMNLTQTKEEDYMPMPLVPEYLNFDGAGSTNMIANRPRRGQARRGRPRRDFQRDILPGLPSLSRLEVTEDLQMFGGLWNSGVARRSSNRGGSSRGRKQLNRAPVCSSLVHPMNNNSVQMVGLEDRSITGWGNATRRPRRQRCPAAAGTPTTMILT